MLALGLDPGTATTGYGLVQLLEDGSLQAVEFGVISTAKDLSAPKRLSLLYHRLNLRLQPPHTSYPSVVIIGLAAKVFGHFGVRKN